MSIPIKCRLICEGPSEWTYIQRYFEKIWQTYLAFVGKPNGEHYKKGALSEDFISVDSLTNMVRHCGDPDFLKLFKLHAPAGAFPLFLSGMLQLAYSDVF